MGRPKIILIGAGGHAYSCIDVIEQQGYFQIAGLVGFPEQRGERRAGHGYAVIGSDDDLSELAKTYQYALITIGQIQGSEHRARLYGRVIQLGFQLPLIVSPSAYISRHAQIGAGTIVMHGAIINAGAVVGNNCIINSRALIEHESKVGDHCHISTGAILNGRTTVGDGSFIGSGSIVKQGIFVGIDCTVGMGLSIRHNIDDETIFTGHINNEQ